MFCENHNCDLHVPNDGYNWASIGDYIFDRTRVPDGEVLCAVCRRDRTKPLRLAELIHDANL